MSDYQNQRIETPMDDWRMVLTAPPTKGAEKSPIMRPSIAHDGSFKLTVFTNAPSDEGNQGGKIDFVFGQQQMEALSVMAEEIIKSDKAMELVMEHHDFIWIKQKRSEDVKLRSKLYLGRTEDGRFYIAILSYNENRPKIRFYFGNGQKFRILQSGENTTVSEAFVSALWMKTWLSAVAATHQAYLAKHYRTKEERKAANGNNGGGNRGYSSGGGNSNNAPARQSHAENDDWS